VGHQLFVNIDQIHQILQIHLQRLLLPIHHQSMFQLKQLMLRHRIRHIQSNLPNQVIHHFHLRIRQVDLFLQLHLSYPLKMHSRQLNN
jgi:hypothetical protein